MMFRTGRVHFLAIALLGCSKEGPDDLADDGDTETTEDGTTDGELEIGDDADDEWTGTDDQTDDQTSGNDTVDETCEYGEYIPSNYGKDWEQASGYVSYGVSGGLGSSHGVDATFATNTGPNDSMICVEWLVGDADVGIDACNVYYMQGFGLGGEWPDQGYQQPAVDTATFDVGEGPVALEAFSPGETPWGEPAPTSYRGNFAPPPEGVPFGGIATLAVNFADLPDLDLDLDVPEQLILTTPVFDSMTLGSEELASWTWSSSDGSEPITLEIGLSPTGSNGPERVVIQCDVTDDGEFAFPTEYFDLAREQLGSEITAIAEITRRTRGQVPLAGENLYWRSTHHLFWEVAVVD